MVKKCNFKSLQKLSLLTLESLRLSGNWFQADGPATEKAWTVTLQLWQRFRHMCSKYDGCFLFLCKQFVRSLKNFRAEQPHQHAVYYTNALAAEQFWTKDELLEATEGNSVDIGGSHYPTLKSRQNTWCCAWSPHHSLWTYKSYIQIMFPPYPCS